MTKSPRLFYINTKRCIIMYEDRMNYLQQQVDNYFGNKTQPQTDYDAVEQHKIRVCRMLQDLQAGDFKTIACNCIVDELTAILKLPLHAEDRMFFDKQLRLLNQPNEPQKQANFKSAQELVEQSKNGHKSK